MVLIVDDHVDTSRALTRLFRLRCGWKVTAVDRGQAALDLLKAAKPSVVLLDLTMPDLDGAEVLRRIRESQPPTRDVPVIIYSAVADDERRLAVLKLGANEYLVKGRVQWDAICDVLRKYVDPDARADA